MGKILLTIQHGNNLFSPPIKGEVTIEWERTGSPGKMKFTTVKSTTEDMSFLEGDAVCFYYDDKPVFMGYVFKKTRDREQHIEVTCYDQLRYLKNKYTYVFENKSASQIITALCKDFNLNVGTMDNTGYTIPAIAEDNKSALDIILDVVEETLMNTKKMFVVYDDFGKITLKNCANMVSDVVIMDTTAENFDYTSSIDNETYNNIVLYYKTDDNQVQVYTAYSPTTIQKWGKLRYFEEVDTPTNGQNKAEQLLRLYNRKTRELKVSGAFGDSAIRGGTLIPVKLNLGDVVTSNYMLVDKVTHTFDNDVHLMDLTLQGYWDDGEYDVKSETIGTIVKKVEASTENTGNTGNSGNTGNTGNTHKNQASGMANAIVQGIKSGLSTNDGNITTNKTHTISFDVLYKQTGGSLVVGLIDSLVYYVTATDHLDYDDEFRPLSSPLIFTTDYTGKITYNGSHDFKIRQGTSLTLMVQTLPNRKIIVKQANGKVIKQSSMETIGGYNQYRYNFTPSGNLKILIDAPLINNNTSNQYDGPIDV